MTSNEQLLQASRDAMMETVIHALSTGANVNATDEYGWTAFMNATWNSDANMMRLLRIQHGANVALLSDDGYSAAHYAARAGRTFIIGQFTSEELNQPDGDGLTPIFHAAIFGHKATFNTLRMNGADDTLKSPGGHTCYDYARLFGDKVA